MSRRTITLTSRRPVIIEEGDWPVIAESKDEDCQLKVRQHKDGRCIVYGVLGSGHDAVRRGYYVAGYSVDGLSRTRPTDEALITAIRQTAAELDAEELAHACIAALPAEDLGAA